MSGMSIAYDSWRQDIVDKDYNVLIQNVLFMRGTFEISYMLPVFDSTCKTAEDDVRKIIETKIARTLEELCRTT